MTIEEQIKQLMPAMTEQVAAAIRERALKNLEYTMADAVTTEVKKYVADVVAPAVRDELAKLDTAIRAAVIAAMQTIGEKLAETLVAQFTEKMTGYQGDRLIKEVFGPMFRGY